MFNKWKAISRKGFWPSGQGLVEYGLLLTLVAVVTILAVSLLGGQIQEQFCATLSALGGIAPEVEVCNAPQVACIPHDKGHGKIEVQAVVTINSAGDSVDRVDFYVDGEFKVDEFADNYCLGGTDNCATSSGYGVSSGSSHVIQAIATTTEGYTGQCSITVTAN